MQEHIFYGFSGLEKEPTVENCGPLHRDIAKKVNHVDTINRVISSNFRAEHGMAERDAARCSVKIVACRIWAIWAQNSVVKFGERDLPGGWFSHSGIRASFRV